MSSVQVGHGLHTSHGLCPFESSTFHGLKTPSIQSWPVGSSRVSSIHSNGRPLHSGPVYRRRSRRYWASLVGRTGKRPLTRRISAQQKNTTVCQGSRVYIQTHGSACTQQLQHVRVLSTERSMHIHDTWRCAHQEPPSPTPTPGPSSTPSLVSLPSPGTPPSVRSSRVTKQNSFKVRIPGNDAIG